MAQGTFKTILENPIVTKTWLRMGESRPFFEALEEWRQQVLMQLKTMRDPVDIHRAQGNLEVLDKILQWRKEL